ncbi:DUF6912 family protein [Vallicoccus soli]|uniref:Uncharacterized protein n=1 Tax=Vallicoccus soli TaxID=2339232 RepID=A0A3A3YYQ0_9ACTN|nr:hypothetical protein [Vallicoccus soli]RJK95424.1 hypothetical protein D5H78_12270 [Vallicoccus soli]
MRVYLPTTLPALAALRPAGEVGPAPLAAHAVTPALREWYAGSDDEELEYAAAAGAARASLALLAAELGRDPGARARRVVLAADVPDAAVRPAPGDRSAVVLGQPVPWRLLASVHVDDAAAEDDVRAAAGALAAAAAGDEDAALAVDGAEDHELLWYGVQEVPDLVG